MTDSERRGVAAARRFPTIVAVLAGVAFAAYGAWAMTAPRSFFQSVARFEPYNQHFVQDIGAFQIGLAAVLLVAASTRRADALAVALVGTGIGSLAHLVSHVVGIDLGGTPATDIPSFALLTGLLLAGGLLRWRMFAVRPRLRPDEPTTGR